MSMQGPGGAGGRDPGAQRWGAEKEQIDKQAREEHLVHEAERIHAEEAAEEAARRGAQAQAPLVEVLGVTSPMYEWLVLARIVGVLGSCSRTASPRRWHSGCGTSATPIGSA